MQEIVYEQTSIDANGVPQFDPTRPLVTDRLISLVSQITLACLVIYGLCSGA